jgi:meso-butanediol dehydrogenase/(S,S)-butanediol dehydrogenase/diacetyl reductase
MPDKLKNRVAIVTGGAAGIGAAIAAAYVAEGARVAIADRNGTLAAQTAATLGSAALALTVDVTREDEVRRLVADTLAHFGRIDILVNNAGVMRRAWVKDMTEAAWDEVLNVNLKATFLCSKAVLPTMVECRAGRIINIASIAGKVGEPTAAAYSAAKFGVIGFTRALAHEVAQHNILVNAICPGPIPTALGQQGWREGAEVLGVALDAIMARVNARSPLGRLGTPQQVARMALFVASDDCDFTTGAAFNVDGGIVMH